MSAEFVGAAAGNVSQPFVLTNTGNASCVLQGYPTRLQGWQDGRWNQLTFTQGTFFLQEDPSPRPIELGPGARAELIVGTDDACNGENVGDSMRYSRLLVTLADETSLELDEPVNAFCGLAVSSFHLLPIPQSSPPIASQSVASAAPTNSRTSGPCTSAQLTVTFGERQQVMAQPAIAVIFTNTSDAACTLYGYPGVAGLDSAGDQIAQAVRTPQVYMGGAPTDVPSRVMLASGAQASALIGGSANPINGEIACPPDYAAVRVTPPGTTEATRLDVDFPSCSGLLVTPVVPGATGGYFDPLANP